MYKVIVAFQYISTFIKFLIELDYNVLKTVFVALRSLISIFSALPGPLIVFFIGIAVVSIAYKVISLGGSGE